MLGMTVLRGVVAHHAPNNVRSSAKYFLIIEAFEIKDLRVILENQSQSLIIQKPL
jgi:hypothetical protein